MVGSLAWMRARAFSELAGCGWSYGDGTGGRGTMCDANADVQVNMIEGGVTEWISPAELSELGVRLVAYPMPLLGAAVKAMQARAALQVGTVGVGLRCKWEMR